MANSIETEHHNNEAESEPKILEPFFAYENKICIIDGDGLRLEFSKQEYQQAKEQAERELSTYPSLIVVKIRQLLGVELDKASNQSDKINLKAAETFPEDKKLFALMVRSLSPDIPGAQLSEQEQEELDNALQKI